MEEEEEEEEEDAMELPNLNTCFFHHTVRRKGHGKKSPKWD
jgi:hypothetical protein